MLRFTILFSFILFSISLGQSQNASTNRNYVLVEISMDYGKIYRHQMSPKETVYSLSKVFDQKVSDIERSNPEINLNQLSIGQVINIPFESKILVKHPKDINPRYRYIPVYYKVRAKDNLFRIAKIYFNQTIENILFINKIESMELNIGQEIQVGWIHQDPSLRNSQPITSNFKTINKKENNTPASTSPASKPEPTQSELVQEEARKEASRQRRKKKSKSSFMSKIKKTFGINPKKKEIKKVVQLSDQLEEKELPSSSEVVSEEEIITPIAKQENTESEAPTFMPNSAPLADSLASSSLEVEEVKNYKFGKGVAIWNQTSSSSKNMIALHPSAKVGSIIYITNPMMNTTVQAKVIGNIPPRTYTDDVSLIVSPYVAKQLGVVDRRFMVHIKFEE